MENRPEDWNNLAKILIDWLGVKGCYAYFLGGPDGNGATEVEIATAIVSHLNTKEVRVTYNGNQVK